MEYHFNCSIHGPYIGTSSRQKCPKCIEENAPKCLICGSRSIYKNNLCRNCFDKTSKTHNFNNDKKTYLQKCEIHGFFLSNGTRNNCPICYPQTLRNKICKICGKKFIDDRRFDYVVNSKIDICKECENKLPIAGDSSLKPKFLLRCEKHGLYLSTATNCICPICSKEANRSETVKNFYNMKSNTENIIENGILMLPISYKTSSNREYPLKICEQCGRYFRPNNGSQIYCGKCYEILTCPVCKEHFIKFTNENRRGCCSVSCSNKRRNLNIVRSCHKFNIRNPIYFIPEHQIINSENLNEFNISGVWYKYDPNENIVLDVCSTLNIKEEVKYHFNSIKNKIKMKYIEMSKIKNIEFYYLCSFQKWEEALKKELDFAMKTEAKYWRPAPGLQMKMYIQIKKGE